jgi:amidase
MTDKLYAWTAVDLAKAIASKKISSRETLESCLERTAEINPQVNAIVDLVADEARAAADDADAAVRRGEALGSLHGVPVTIKINLDYAGRATTNGVGAFKDLIAKEDNLASFSDAPMSRLCRRAISPTTTSTAGRTIRGTARSRPAARAAAARRRC